MLVGAEHMSATTEPGADPLLDEDLRSILSTRAERKVRMALQIKELLIAGYRPGEIRELLSLTPKEYARATEWLQDALSLLRQ